MKMKNIIFVIIAAMLFLFTVNACTVKQAETTEVGKISEAEKSAESEEPVESEETEETEEKELALELTQENSSFINPTGLLADEDGSLYVSDRGLNAIYKLKEGVSELYAGYPLPDDKTGKVTGGYSDASRLVGLFNSPQYLAVWNKGIAVSDRDNNVIRWIYKDKIYTLCGSGKEDGSENGKYNDVSLLKPQGICCDEDDNLYIADSGNHRIIKLDTTGTVTTVSSDFDQPCGLYWFDDVIYVTDVGTNQIYKINGKEKSVIAGVESDYENDEDGGHIDGAAEEAKFRNPMGITVKDGNIYIADTGNSAIRLIKDGTVSTVISNEDEGIASLMVSPFCVEFVGKDMFISDCFNGNVYTIRNFVYN